MAIAGVNTTHADAGSGASIAAAAASHTAGNLICVFVSWEGTGTLNTVTDTAGNTYHKLTEAREAGAVACQIAYADNCLGHATNIVTANFTGTIDYSNIIVRQYSGALTSATPYDVEATGASGGAGSATGTTGNLTSAEAGEVLFGGVGCYSAVTATYTRPATELIDSVGSTTSAGETLPLAQGTYAGSVALSGSCNWAMAMAAFKQAAAGGATAVPVFMAQYSQRWG